MVGEKARRQRPTPASSPSPSSPRLHLSRPQWTCPPKSLSALPRLSLPHTSPLFSPILYSLAVRAIRPDHSVPTKHDPPRGPVPNMASDARISHLGTCPSVHRTVLPSTVSQDRVRPATVPRFTQIRHIAFSRPVMRHPRCRKPLCVCAASGRRNGRRSRFRPRSARASL